MSETIHTPWIRKFALQQIAQDDKITEESKKSRHCQLVQLYTYDYDRVPLMTERSEPGLWVGLNDKDVVATVFLTQKSIEDWIKKNQSGAILRVKPRSLHFVPHPSDHNGGLRQREDPVIVGELHDILGSVGEPRFGDPKPLLDDPAIQAWSASKRGQAVQYEDEVRKALDAIKLTEKTLSRQSSRSGSRVLAGAHIPEKTPKDPPNEKPRTNKLKKEWKMKFFPDRTLELKQYTVPPDQQALLDKIVSLAADAMRTPKPANLDSSHIPSSPKRPKRDINPLLSSSPTQATGEQTFDDEPSHTVGDDEEQSSNEQGDDGIHWAQSIDGNNDEDPEPASSPMAMDVDVTQSSPIAQVRNDVPVVLVPNSDPTQSHTQSQSQKSRTSRGSQQSARKRAPDRPHGPTGDYEDTSLRPQQLSESITQSESQLSPPRTSQSVLHEDQSQSQLSEAAVAASQLPLPSTEPPNDALALSTAPASVLPSEEANSVQQSQHLIHDKPPVPVLPQLESPSHEIPDALVDDVVPASPSPRANSPVDLTHDSGTRAQSVEIPVTVNGDISAAQGLSALDNLVNAIRIYLESKKNVVFDAKRTRMLASFLELNPPKSQAEPKIGDVAEEFFTTLLEEEIADVREVQSTPGPSVSRKRRRETSQAIDPEPVKASFLAKRQRATTPEGPSPQKHNATVSARQAEKRKTGELPTSLPASSPSIAASAISARKSATTTVKHSPTSRLPTPVDLGLVQEPGKAPLITFVQAVEMLRRVGAARYRRPNNPLWEQ